MLTWIFLLFFFLTAEKESTEAQSLGTLENPVIDSQMSRRDALTKKTGTPIPEAHSPKSGDF